MTVAVTEAQHCAVCVTHPGSLSVDNTTNAYSSFPFVASKAIFKSTSKDTIKAGLVEGHSP